MIERDGSVELHLAGNEISIGVSAQTGNGRRLRMGSVAGIRTNLERGPLAGSILESAIAEIEDLIMPALRSLQGASDLRVSGPELASVIQELGSHGAAVPISAVEALFNEVADIASGSPARLHRVSTEPGFVLGLVLLREVMHHGGFSSASAVPEKPSRQPHFDLL